MAMDEGQAVARLQGGDIGGLEALVRLYHARAVRSAYLVTRDLDTAEDVAQAAFLKAYEHIRTFDARRPFGPWFLKGVLRDAVKAATKRDRTVPLAGESVDEGNPARSEIVDPDAGPAALWAQRETAEVVMAALGALPPAERAVIVQRYYLGLSEAEMARAADCPPGTVKSRLHAARGRLRTLLQPLQQDSEVRS
jgi:RNA polymerase sigma-70 factor, ECF subfamily